MDYFVDLPFRPGVHAFRWIVESGAPVLDVRIPTTVVASQSATVTLLTTEAVTGARRSGRPWKRVVWSSSLHPHSLPHGPGKRA